MKVGVLLRFPERSVITAFKGGVFFFPFSFLDSILVSYQPTWVTLSLCICFCCMPGASQPCLGARLVYTLGLCLTRPLSAFCDSSLITTTCTTQVVKPPVTLHNNPLLLLGLLFALFSSICGGSYRRWKDTVWLSCIDELVEW